MKRFWDKVSIGEKNECWEWQGHLTKFGYGMFWLEGRPHYAHRISFLLSGKTLTEEKPCALHHCDNPKCVNPNHLYAGDKKDNAQDMVKRNRCKAQLNAVSGEKNINAKLTQEQVNDIRKACKEKHVPQKDMVEKYHVTKGLISLICNNKRWKHSL
jgi:hypothetical protein